MDEITLSLSFNPTIYVPFLHQPTPPSLKLVVWGDGRVLVKKQKSRETTADEYYFGKMDPKKIQTLLHSIETNLLLKQHQTTILDFGLDASTYLLHVNYPDGMLKVETWEQYNNAEFYPNVNVVQKEDQESERGVLLLPDFYKGWKVIKKDMFDLRDEVMKKPDTKLVNVEWKRREELLIIRDKSGKLIYEGICPVRFLEERRKQLIAKEE